MYSYVKCKGLRITRRMALIKVRMYSLLKYGFLNSKGVTDVLCEACDQLGWAKPTKIQIEAIPLALQGSLELNMQASTEPVWHYIQFLCCF